MHRLLPALAFLSGVSGIAYEVLYVRLISAYVGNIFYVGAALLAVFFFGIALGAFVANRYTQYLKQIEIFIGLYALALSYTFGQLGLSITRWVASLPGPDSLVLPAFVFSIMVVPAIAIGFSLPLFAAYIDHYRKQSETFNFTYALYNVGAALSVVAIEYWFVFSFGINASITLVAAINLLIGGLLFLVPAPPQADRVEEYRKLLAPGGPARRTFIALGVVSIISGVIQLNLFSLSYNIIGPHNENFALLVGASLLGIAIAAIVVHLTRLAFDQWLLPIAIVCLLPFAFLPQIIEAYVDVYLLTTGSLLTAALARFHFVSLLALPIFFAFSTTIPAVVRVQGTGYAGLAIAISAGGNALGYLLYIFVVYELLFHLAVAIGSSTLIVLIYFWYVRRVEIVKLVAGLVSVAGLAVHANYLWPSTFYASTHVDKINNSEMFDQVIFSEPRDPVSIDIYKRFGTDTTLVTLANGNVELHSQGYHSLTFGRNDLSVLRESLAGAVTALFTPKRERALVMGLGSGVTAGAVASSFDQVIVAEINPTMINAAARFARENNGLLSRDNASIRIQDGLITLLESELEYDAIINTVPTPRFFAANKLWTAEVFAAAKDNLSESGVFVAWIDGRLGERGVKIMLQTLHEAFGDCVFLYFSSEYQAFVCGENRLNFLSSPNIPLSPIVVDILRRKGWNAPPHLFVRSLMFRIPRDLNFDEGINSLDHPLLEFIYQPKGDFTDVLEPYSRFLVFDPFDGQPKSNLCDALRLIDPFNVTRINLFCS